MTYQLIAGNGMEQMAPNVAHYVRGRLTVPLEENTVAYQQFANGERKPTVEQNVRGRDVFYFHDMQQPNPNQSLVDLLFTLDAIEGSNPTSVNLVVPYFSYARQDRKDEPHTAISSAVVINAIKQSRKLEEVLTFELHADQLEGTFKPVSVEHLPGRMVFTAYVQDKYGANPDDLVVVSPDHGGEKRAERFAQGLYGTNRIGKFSKRRPEANVNQLVGYDGPDLQDKVVLVYDDMIDTGGSILNVAKEVREMGAKKVYACATHGLFSEKNGVRAEDKFREAGIETLVSNSIPRTSEYYQEHADWLTVVPIEDTLGQVLAEMMSGGSVSQLYQLPK